jgi:hypothetical protein
VEFCSAACDVLTEALNLVIQGGHQSGAGFGFAVCDLPAKESHFVILAMSSCIGIDLIF